LDSLIAKNVLREKTRNNDQNAWLIAAGSVALSPTPFVPATVQQLPNITGASSQKGTQSRSRFSLPYCHWDGEFSIFPGYNRRRP
jgi:hypothetical protein